MIIDACMAQHLGDRVEQQDRVALLQHPKSKGVVLAVVADGMGGYTGGVLAAQQVIHTARNSFEQFSVRTESAHEMIKESLLEAHTLIKASRFINEKEPHSTAVMLVLQPGKASWGHSGDSRLYHFRGKTCLFHTRDHSYVEQLLARGEITAEEARVHPRRNVLITSLGGKIPPEMTFGGSDSVIDNDNFMLCSDGLWSYFTDQELAQTIAAYTAREATDILIREARARARGDGDNISVVLLKCLPE